MKKTALLLISFFWLLANGQNPSIIITLPSNPPANTAQWGTGTAVFNIIVSGSNMALLYESSVLVTIKSGGALKCGSYTASTAPSSNINNNAPKSWIGNAAEGLLGQDCILPPGSYELCVQFYGNKNALRNTLLLEKCVPFSIPEKSQELCSPSLNINPANLKIFTDIDLLKPITFNWSPVISSYRGIITYQLTVWEVEDGQTNAQAIYNNQPVVQEEVKGQTRYTARPGIFEKRDAQYVWRVIAVDEEGKPICKNSQSEPTNFSIKIPEKPEVKTTLNTACGNGDFESGILDPTEWSAGYTKISGNNSTFSPPFNNIMQPANGNPIDAPINTGCGNQANENHHVIVSVGFDPTIPTLNRVPPSMISNKYALRLGNNCPGCGTERILKHFIVTAANTSYQFMYALVFQAPHSLAQNPSLWVRVYDATNTPVTGIVYLDPLSTSPMDRAVSDPANPYWQTYNGILYRDWACARIDLSSLVGQAITVEILTNDCAQCGHYGYGYFDNFCIGCSNNPPPTDCCSDIIKTVSDNTTLLPGNIVNIEQQFNISPQNIKKVTAEIVSVEEVPIDTACMKCIANENWIYQFISQNTTSWNSGTALNASPVNSTGYYPARMVEWYCNQQGNIKFEFKIALPGTANGCSRKSKICIRYSFTDINCKTCEKIICYSVTSN